MTFCLTKFEVSLGTADKKAKGKKLESLYGRV